MGEKSAPGERQRRDLGSWRRIFERSLTPMMIFDDERRILDANSAACLLLRSTRAELCELRFDDLTPAEQLGRLRHLFTGFLEQGSQAGQYTLGLADRQRLDIEYAATANIVPGQHLTVFFLWRTPHGVDNDGMEAPDQQSVPEESTAAGSKLSVREREVLTLLALGDGGEQIAAHLFISPETVRTHIQNARQKLGAATRAHAIALALRDGEISLGPTPPLLP